MSQEWPPPKHPSGTYVRMEFLAEQNEAILAKLEQISKEVHQLEITVKVDLTKVVGRVEALEQRVVKAEDNRRGVLSSAGGGAAAGGGIAAIAELLRHLLSGAG